MNVPIKSDKIKCEYAKKGCKCDGCPDCKCNGDKERQTNKTEDPCYD
jgi:hypothetical protein